MWHLCGHFDSLNRLTFLWEWVQTLSVKSVIEVFFSPLLSPHREVQLGYLLPFLTNKWLSVWLFKQADHGSLINNSSVHCILFPGTTATTINSLTDCYSLLVNNYHDITLSYGSKLLHHDVLFRYLCFYPMWHSESLLTQVVPEQVGVRASWSRMPTGRLRKLWFKAIAFYGTP